MKTPALLALATVALAAFAGCVNPLKDPPVRHYADLGFTGADVSGRDPTDWPDLHGAKVRVLDNGAFEYAFGDAKTSFERLTNGTVDRIEAPDAGSALSMVIAGKGKPPADVIYGLDNAMYAKAVDEGVLEPFKPALAPRIRAEHVFFGSHQTAPEAWFATPVDYGYVGVNYDPRVVPSVKDFADIRLHAGELVTEDPALSSPGLGFLLATIDTFGEGTVYDWHDYWRDLFRGKVLVVDSWSTAYQQHWSAGYNSQDVKGEDEGGKSDRAMVVSYTNSPAFEAFGGRADKDLGRPVTGPGTTWKQVQTMAILEGARDRLAAEAWIEFTLTDEFQRLAAPANVVYPVVEWEDPAVDPALTYMGRDPAPGSFEPAEMDWRHVGDNLDRWLCEWDALRDGEDDAKTLCLQDQ